MNLSAASLSHFQQCFVSDPISGTTFGLFHLDSVSGQLSTMASLDRENLVEYYDITIAATDAGSDPKSVTRTVRVSVLDYNDNAPSFPFSKYDVTIPESIPQDTSVLSVTATDKDVTTTILTYSIHSGNSGNHFEFDSSTLNMIKTKSPIDLDRPSSDADFYSLVIHAIDNGSPSLTGSATVNIVITSSNDHVPSFSMDSTSVHVSWEGFFINLNSYIFILSHLCSVYEAKHIN